MVTFALMTASAQDEPAACMPRDEISGLITYKEVIEEEGSKDTLFNRCSSWLHTFYSNPWEATKGQGPIVGHYKNPAPVQDI